MQPRPMSLISCMTVCIVAAASGIAAGQNVRRGAEPAKVAAPAPRQADAAPVTEQQFISAAAMANMAEIQLGHLATKKAQTDAVITFARQMVDDHIKSQNELAEAGRGGGVEWPKRLDDKHAAIQRRLSALTGVDFEREYLEAMIAAHRDVEQALVARTSGARTAGGDSIAAVTEWSQKTLPDVRAHLKKAGEVSGALEAGSTSRRSN